MAQGALLVQQETWLRACTHMVTPATSRFSQQACLYAQ